MQLTVLTARSALAPDEQDVYSPGTPNIPAERNVSRIAEKTWALRCSADVLTVRCYRHRAPLRHCLLPRKQEITFCAKL